MEPEAITGVKPNNGLNRGGNTRTTLFLSDTTKKDHFKKNSKERNFVD